MEDVIKSEIEYKILTAAIIFGEAERQKIFANLTPSHFKDDVAKSAFQKISSLFEKYPNADGSSYIGVLDAKEKEMLISATQSAVLPTISESQLDDTIKLIKNKSRDEKLKSALTDAVLSGETSYLQLKSIIERFEQNEPTEKSSAERYIDEYSKPFEYVPTGFAHLDTVLNGGLIKGTFATIGARPSTGKTSYAINIVSHNPKLKTLFFSLEMSSSMIYDRLIAIQTNLSYALTGKHKAPIETVKYVLNKFEGLNIIDDVFYVEEIVNLIYEQKPDLVVVDYVQIVGSQERCVDNRQRIDFISRKLKATAKKMNCCIVILSQLTRNGKDKPTMSDLKESGGLEQDSDYIILLHRPYVNDKSNDNISPKDTTVTLDKNKFGNTMEFQYNFDGSHQRFFEKENEAVAHMISNNSEDEEVEDLPF